MEELTTKQRTLLIYTAKKIMNRVDDPFHDYVHTIEVWETAKKIIKNEKITLTNKNYQLLELACLWHDTSRQYIGTSLFLQPFLDGIVSAYSLHREAKKIVPNSKYIEECRNIIIEHEVGVGFFHTKKRTISKILIDADKIECFSADRVKRGIERFEKGIFSLYLLNYYALTLLLLFRNANSLVNNFEFEHSKYLAKKKQLELLDFLVSHKKILKQYLYRWNYNFIYSRLPSKKELEMITVPDY